MDNPTESHAVFMQKFAFVNGEAQKLFNKLVIEVGDENYVGARVTLQDFFSLAKGTLGSREVVNHENAAWSKAQQNDFSWLQENTQ